MSYRTHGKSSSRRSGGSSSSRQRRSSRSEISSSSRRESRSHSRRGSRRHKHHWSQGQKNLAIIAFSVVGILILMILPGNERDLDMLYGPPGLLSRGIRYSCLVGDREFMFTVSALDVPGTDGFKVTEPAPISLQDVLKKADDALVRYVSLDEIDNWIIEHVSLNKCYENKWYYIVSFRPCEGDRNSDGSERSIRIPVLLNGMVINGIGRSRNDLSERDEPELTEGLAIDLKDVLLDDESATDDAPALSDIEVLSNVDRGMVQFTIPRHSLEKSDDCDPLSQLPFRMHQAALKAFSVYHRYLPAGSSSGWHLHSVALNRWGNSDKWYYIVEFRMENVDSGLVFPQLLIPVLSNGEVISGVKLEKRKAL